MNSVVAEAFALAALLALAGLGGWSYRGEQDQKQLQEANTSVTACGSAADAKAAALTRVQAQLTDLRTQHNKALADADKALAARTEEIKTLTQRATDRATHIAQAPHENANCAALALLPICPAVARELWPPATQAGAGDHAPGGD